MAAFKRYADAVLSALAFHFLRFGREWLVTAVALLFFGGISYFAFAAPAGFLPGTDVIVPKGATAVSVAAELAEARVIRHPELFRTLLRFSGAGGSIKAGAYRFASRENALQVAWRLAHADYGIAPVRVTFWEGMSARAMGLRIAKAVPEISAPDFISAGQPYEGFLFPDTYFIPPSADAESVVAQMRANFDTKIASLMPAVAASGHSISEIITMASLIEVEAGSSKDRHLIAGVLWNRINKGMPLQVDAVFGYIFGRDTYSPSFDDLSVDSPYNTYTHKGLPPGPIGNPGFDAIDAALHPTKSNYLYYLTGKDGVTRYSATYQGQLANQRAYLR